jgi:hypothetical protein
MRLLLITLAAIVCGMQAHAWNKIIDCNNGEFVVDQGDNDSMGRPTYQLVFRGQPLNYFLQQDAVDSKAVNEKGEFIVEVNTYDGALKGFVPYQILPNGMHTYRNYWITRHNGDVSFRATVGNKYTGESERANWYFHNCQ